MRGQIAKIDGTDRRVDPDAEVDTAIKQIVSDAMASGGVIDIYAEAGLTRPDLSLIDDEFIDKVRQSNRPNLQIEMLRRLLNDEITRISRKRLVAGREFSEMLNESIRRYQNRSLDSAEVIAALVDLAQHLKREADRGAQLGLAADELAFYRRVVECPLTVNWFSANQSLPSTSAQSISRARAYLKEPSGARYSTGTPSTRSRNALQCSEKATCDSGRRTAVATNDSAVTELGDETLKKIATELVAVVRRDAKTDWAVKEQVSAQLRRNIKRLLRRYHYPPDQQENAVRLVLQQAEVIADDWAAA